MFLDGIFDFINKKVPADALTKLLPANLSVPTKTKTTSALSTTATVANAQKLAQSTNLKTDAVNLASNFLSQLLTK